MELTQEEKQFIIEVFKVVEIKGNYQHWQSVMQRMNEITSKLVKQPEPAPNGVEPEPVTQ